MDILIDKNKLPYNPYDIKSIERYASTIIGKTFGDIIQSSQYDKYKTYDIKDDNKGGLGNIVEEAYFYYKANNDQRPDFEEVGLELKTTPYEILKKGEVKAGERLVITKINYNEPVEDDLYSSHLWNKCRKMLIIWYLRDSTRRRMLYRFDYEWIFTPPESDITIIKSDYNIIISKIKAGKAHELSESDTLYLGASTKGGSTTKSQIAIQYYGDRLPAKTRAFSFKASYMTNVLRSHLAGKKDIERIIDNAKLLHSKTFEEIISDKIEKYKGYSDYKLCKEFGIKYTKNKVQWINIAWRMLGIKSNKAIEFEKANIKIKAIRIEENGKIKEDMSFPVYKYKELVKEEWETSTLREYFDETKLLFVVFKRQGEHYYLRGCQLWNMPYNDLNIEVKQGWHKVVNTIREGVQLTINPKRGTVNNNFPSKNENRIIHTRPHASKTYYRFLDGRTIGESKNKIYSNQLPSGEFMPNYCFWLNKSYVIEQLEDRLKE